MTEEQIETRSTRRVSPLLLVAVAVLVLALLFFFVLMPLISQDDEVIETPPAARPGAAASPQPEEAPEEPPAETFEVFESKDPFRPLVTEAAANGAATGGGGTTTGGTANGGTGTTNGTGAGGAPAPSGGQRVNLLDVLEDQGQTKAQVKVGSTVYTVAPGEVFADNFKVVSVSGNCATMLHGDDKFTLCEGEEVIK